MPKCQFCSFYKNGDFIEDHEIIDEDFDVDFAHKLELHGGDHDVIADVIIEKKFSIAAYIDQNDNENNLVVYLDTPDYERQEEFFDKELKRKINFCPVCGRDLRKGMGVWIE